LPELRHHQLVLQSTQPLIRATSCRTDLIRASLARRQGRHAELVVGETTVRTHVTRILARLGAGDGVQAVVAAYESGLVQPGSA
jgi:hypothetical protein